METDAQRLRVLSLEVACLVFGAADLCAAFWLPPVWVLALLGYPGLSFSDVDSNVEAASLYFAS